MKRVKVMLSAILVMAIVAGALAFKVKTPDVCAYAFTTTQATPDQFTTCTLTHLTTEFVETATTTIANPSVYARVVAANTASATPCPNTTIANCPQSRTLVAED